MQNTKRLAITYVAVDSLLPHPRNAHTHSKRQVRQIADSIEAFGFNSPILIDGNNIIAGHGRAAAAKLLGISQVPTICLEGLSEFEIRAYLIADNRLCEQAGWDRSLLAVEFRDLLTIEDSFSVELTGFTIPEIDIIVEEAKASADQDDCFQVKTQDTPITKPGDLWSLGKHRIFCGNALEETAYKALMSGRKAQIAFADPPFNVPIQGHASGNGSIHHREFAMASGEMSEAQFIAFLTTSFGLMARHTVSGSVHYLVMDWRHLREILKAGERVYDQMLNLCIWSKDNAGLGSFYRSQHELIFVFRNGEGQHRNNVELGRFGRNRTNIWSYPSANTFSRQGDEGNLLALHPTVKPVALIADALLDASARGDIVVDPFLGSGTTLIAAERVGRICFGLELDPLYVDIAIRRWQSLTGDQAVHSSTGKSFNEVSRSSEVKNG